ncbi:hypothetical protein AB8O55_11750 [Saccharopolyspora cebuensis]|uniref:Uncharacterized protein n=1 Tax=Saccharopolyspora cebuensis TaxID=418759 RepID=A0ABV4CG41_9PSEU
MEPAVTPVTYPEMRAEVIDALGCLSDPDYQQRVWIRHEYPTEGFYDDLTINVNILFDDARVLPDPEPRVGWVLHPTEVDAMRTLGQALEPLIDNLGEASDARYLEHPQWPEIITRARHAHQVLVHNDTTNE